MDYSYDSFLTANECVKCITCGQMIEAGSRYCLITRRNGNTFDHKVECIACAEMRRENEKNSKR